jgi:hypothetical protein
LRRLSTSSIAKSGGERNKFRGVVWNAYCPPMMGRSESSSPNANGWKDVMIVEKQPPYTNDGRFCSH